MGPCYRWSGPLAPMETALLIRPADAATVSQCRALVTQNDFGQLVVSGRGDGLPVIVPTHFVFLPDSDSFVLHLARANPVFEALAHSPRAVMSVVADWVYVPTSWGAAPGSDPRWGVPTSYYAAVQATGTVKVHGGDGENSGHDAARATADILNTQLGHFQPEAGHHRVEPGDSPYGRLLPAIVGLELKVESWRGKFKFAGNKTPEHRARIADWLAERGGPADLAAREYILDGLGGSASP